MRFRQFRFVEEYRSASLNVRLNKPPFVPRTSIVESSGLRTGRFGGKVFHRGPTPFETLAWYSHRSKHFQFRGSWPGISLMLCARQTTDEGDRLARMTNILRRIPVGASSEPAPVLRTSSRKLPWAPSRNVDYNRYRSLSNCPTTWWPSRPCKLTIVGFFFHFVDHTRTHIWTGF